MSGRIGRTTVVYFLSQVAGTAAGFLATWFIASQLGETVLGEYTVVVGLLFWFNVPASAIGQATKKRLSEGDEVRPYLGAGHLLNGFVTLLLSVAIVLASGPINAMVNGRPVAELLVLLVAAQGAFDVTLDSLGGIKKVGASGVLKTIERVFRSTFQIAVVVVSAGFLWLVAGHVVALVVATAIGVAVLGAGPALPSRRHVDRLVEFARYSWLGRMKTRAFTWMDTLVLGAFAAYGFTGAVDVTHGQIGIYEAAWRFATTLSLLSVSINQTLFPELSSLSSDENFEEVRHLVGEGLAFTGLFAVPGVVGSALLGGDLLTIYRPSFAEGKWILVILVGAILLSGFNRQFVNAIAAVDRPDITFRINLLFLAFNLVANIVLVTFFGWYGAAAATALSAGMSLVIAAVAFRRVVGEVPVPRREIGSQLGATVVMATVILRLRPLFPETAKAAVALVGIGAAVYGLTLLAISTRFRGKVRGILGQ